MTKKWNRVLETPALTLLPVAEQGATSSTVERPRLARPQRAFQAANVSLQARRQPARVHSFASRRRGK
jgi:hypothetical protein